MRTLRLKSYTFNFSDENSIHPYFSFFKDSSKLYGHREIQKDTVNELFNFLKEYETN